MPLTDQKYCERWLDRVVNLECTEQALLEKRNCLMLYLLQVLEETVPSNKQVHVQFTIFVSVLITWFLQ